MALTKVKLAVLSFAFAFSNVDAYWRMSCSTVQTGRIDPVVSPGMVSSHVHKLVGASNINISSTYDTLRQASCTSCSVQADKSAYWTPLLYYQHADGTFEEVYAGGMAIYYLGRGNATTGATPFPPGFRMLSGDMSARSYDNTTLTYGNVRPVADRVSFACLDDQAMAEQPYMFRTSCKYGMRAQIHFQSCWNGRDLYRSDNSHVAYMSDIDNGECPPTHPVQLVHLFYEVLYSMDSVTQDGGRFVFAQGDPTGYGFHGDFINGWDQKTIKNATKECAFTDNDGDISDCPILAATNDDNAAWNCPEQPSIVEEPVSGRISKLPGCIKVDNGPANAPIGDMVCAAGVPQPSLRQPSKATGTATTTLLPTPGQSVNNWAYVGCATDSFSPRSLSGTMYTNSTGMTTESCQSFCLTNGYIYAGTENGQECWCDNTLNSASTLGQTDCDLNCAGNGYEKCGGAWRLSVWKSEVSQHLKRSTSGTTLSTVRLSARSTIGACTPITRGTQTSGPSSSKSSASSSSSSKASASSSKSSSSSSAPSSSPTGGSGGAVSLGCYSEATNQRALSGASYVDTTDMTNEACESYCKGKGFTYAGTEYSQECYCGNSFNAGSVGGQTGCTMACTGNKNEICGGPNRLTVWNVSGSGSGSSSSSSSTKASATSSPTSSPSGGAVSLGCYSEATNQRALSGASYVDTTGMTNEACESYCKGKGFTYAGTEYSQECYCGNSFNAGSVGGQTGCTMACTGNKNEICGGPNRLTVWSVSGSGSGSGSSSSTTSSAPSSPTGVGSYQLKGCYSEGTTGRALVSNSYVDTTGMTVESCIAFCQKSNYPYAGVEWSQECYCGTTISNGAAPASSSDCNMVCTGNSKEICGGSSRIDIYYNGS
ncbi:WSC-domain-containing protein [Xylona heveae TC161]|uniref:WSC-domain-containing protein n=1 Tax=Xylona heveae (strain CBS 132557 / TC161) TaxID=1328760 RepID=A0A164ZHT5_XYLHT|nr:WSC-domain-containing protein [Xylona heveae TC161]KZF19119.1 WSC-domain-containing protein [Xylona heveae TC161]